MAEDVGGSAEQQPVPGIVAHAVVDLLEPVQVKIGDAQRGVPLALELAQVLIEFVAVVHPGEGVPQQHPFEDGGLGLDAGGLGVDLLLEILIGELTHFAGEAHLVLRHFRVGVGDVEVAAPGPILHIAEYQGKPLVDPQEHVAGGVGLQPVGGRAQIDVGGQGQNVVAILGEAALGHHPFHRPEQLDHLVRLGGKFRLARPLPDALLPVHQVDEGLRIILTVVLAQHIGGQLFDFADTAGLDAFEMLQHAHLPGSAIPIVYQISGLKSRIICKYL